MTSLAAIAHHPSFLEHAFSPLTARVLALAHYGRALPISRTAAALMGAMAPVALYLAFVAPELWTAMHACVGRPPV